MLDLSRHLNPLRFAVWVETKRGEEDEDIIVSLWWWSRRVLIKELKEKSFFAYFRHHPSISPPIVSSRAQKASSQAQTRDSYAFMDFISPFSTSLRSHEWWKVFLLWLVNVSVPGFLMSARLFIEAKRIRNKLENFTWTRRYISVTRFLYLT